MMYVRLVLALLVAGAFAMPLTCKEDLAISGEPCDNHEAPGRVNIFGWFGRSSSRSSRKSISKSSSKSSSKSGSSSSSSGSGWLGGIFGGSKSKSSAATAVAPAKSSVPKASSAYGAPYRSSVPAASSIGAKRPSKSSVPYASSLPKRPSRPSVPYASSLPKSKPVGSTWRGASSAAPWFAGGLLAGAALPLFAGSAVGRPENTHVRQPGKSDVLKNPTRLTAKSDYSWAAAARVGAGSGNILTFLVDTGSNATWAPASSSNVTNHKKVSGTGSQEPFSISYGSGTVSGHKTTTNFEIAGLNVNDFPMGLAELESPLFNELPADGILGLAYNTDPNSLMQKLVSSRAISAPEFSIYIDPKNKAPSLQFGGHDSSHYIGDLHYLKINASTGYWSVPFKQLTTGKRQNVTSQPEGQAILDTSAQAIFLPPAHFTSAFPQAKPIANSNTTFTIDCDESINPVVIMFDTVNITLNPKDVLLARDPDDSSRCVLGVFQHGSADAPPEENHAIFCAPFFRAAYTVFSNSQDGSPAVGVAPVVGGYSASSGAFSHVSMNVVPETALFTLVLTLALTLT